MEELEECSASEIAEMAMIRSLSVYSTDKIDIGYDYVILHKWDKHRIQSKFHFKNISREKEIEVITDFLKSVIIPFPTLNEEDNAYEGLIYRFYDVWTFWGYEMIFVKKIVE